MASQDKLVDSFAALGLKSSFRSKAHQRLEERRQRVASGRVAKAKAGRLGMSREMKCEERRVEERSWSSEERMTEKVKRAVEAQQVTMRYNNRVTRFCQIDKHFGHVAQAREAQGLRLTPVKKAFRAPIPSKKWNDNDQLDPWCFHLELQMPDSARRDTSAEYVQAARRAQYELNSRTKEDLATARQAVRLTFMVLEMGKWARKSHTPEGSPMDLD